MYRLGRSLLTLLFLTFGISAQTSDGILAISVKDQFGLAVEGAEIDLAHTDRSRSSLDRRGRTDRQGTLRLVRLTPGEYKLTVSAPGFRMYAPPEVIVVNAEPNEIRVTLDVAPIESNVDIGDQDTVTAESSGSVTVSEELIANLPDDQAALEQALKRLGQAVTGEDLPITVDGVPGGKIPPKEAIQQVRVNQSVFSAQYEGPWGGGIEIFTRQGLKKLQTYVGFALADSRFNASDPFIGRRVPYQLKNFFSSLSGPLFGKKASFFLYGSHTRTDSSSVINAVVLDDDLHPVEFKETVATPNRSYSLNLNVNADPDPKNKIGLGYGFQFNRGENQNTGGFSLPSRANDTRTQAHWLQLSHTYLMNQDVVNQTRVMMNYSRNESFGGSGEAAINVLDAFFGGGSQDRADNGSLRYDVSNETTWQMGRYSLGFGGRIRAEHIDQNSTNNFGGTFTFSGRTAPVLDENNQPIGPTAQITSLEAYRRTLLFSRLGYSAEQIRELGGGANQFTISGGDPTIRASQFDVGFYVQNSYKLNDTMAASFGVRYENQTNIGSHHNFAPRFGFIWSPKSKDKQNPLTILPRVSVGYGLFYSRYGLNNTVAIRQASDADRLQYLVTQPDVLDLFPSVPTVDVLQQFALPQTQRWLRDGFDTPYQSLLNVTVVKRLPKGYSLTFTAAHSRALRQTIVRNINAPLAGTFDPEDPSSAVRPFGDVGNIYETNSDGLSRSTRYNVNLNLPQSQKTFGNLRYSYSRWTNNIAGSSGSPFDPYDFSQEYGPSTNDGVHSVGGYLWRQLPYKFWINGDFSISSGTKFNITTGRDTNGDGAYSERPSFATDPTRPGVISTPYGLLDPNPLPGDRLIPRNLGRGSSTFFFNASFGKTFAFNEDKAKKLPPKQSLNFSLRVQNVFNVVNKGLPIGNMASPNFLRSLSSYSDGSIFIINGARQDNFAGRSMTLSMGFSF
jgi:hypothetical protein